MTKTDELRWELRNTLHPVLTKSSYLISKKFAKIVTGKSNQSVSMMTVGPTGSSKSTSNISLAVNTAVEIAKRTNKGRWFDYFNLDHIAIIDKERIFEVMEIEKRFAVKQLDDIGVGWSARNWRDEMNTVLNDISQVMRTENEIILMTLPDTFLLDKIPRSLVHYFMEMERQKQANYNNGIAFGKFFSVIRKSKEGQTWFKYESLDGARFFKAMFRRPPDSIINPYELIRTRAAKELKADRIASQKKGEKSFNSLQDVVSYALNQYGADTKPKELQRLIKKDENIDINTKTISEYRRRYLKNKPKYK